MSNVRTEIVSCPNCSNKQEIEVWESINVTIDPALKEQLFNGTINSFKCSICTYETRIETALLYHDMTQEFAVQYYPYSFLKIKEFLEDQRNITHHFDELLKSEPKNIPRYLLKPHIVFSLEEMCRYVIYIEKVFKNHIGDFNELLRS